jgi:hypothetical protein
MRTPRSVGPMTFDSELSRRPRAPDMSGAMGLVRSHLPNASKVGVLGFSAGSHLSTHLSNDFSKRSYPRIDAADDLDARPDFAMLLYPWCVVGDTSKHDTSCNADTNRTLTMQLTSATPTTFVVQVAGPSPPAPALRHKRSHARRLVQGSLASTRRTVRARRRRRTIRCTSRILSSTSSASRQRARQPPSCTCTRRAVMASGCARATWRCAAGPSEPQISCGRVALCGQEADPPMDSDETACRHAPLAAGVAWGHLNSD